MNKIKCYKDLDLQDMRALLCVLQPKYKTVKAQYNWINKTLLKIIGCKYGLNPIFEFSSSNTQVFVHVYAQGCKTTLTSNKSNILK